MYYNFFDKRTPLYIKNEYNYACNINELYYV